MFRQDLKRGFTSWAFWLGAGIFAISMIYMCTQFAVAGEAACTPLSGFEGAFYAEMMFFPALLSVLPLGTCFYDEFNSHFYRFSVPRLGWRRFMVKRILSSALLGGLVVMLPVLATLLFCYQHFQIIPTGIRAATFFDVNCEFPMLHAWVPGGLAQVETFTPMDHVRMEALFSAAWLLRFFVFGACWSQLGLAVSAWTDEWASVLVIPLVTFVFINWFGEWLHIPFMMLRGTILMEGELLFQPYWFSALLPLAWGALFILIFMLGMRRRRSLG